MKRCRSCGQTISSNDWMLCPHCDGELEEIEEIEDGDSEPTQKVYTKEGKEPIGVPHGIKVVLEILEGPAKGVLYEVKKGKLIIGRGEADLIIKDAKISRRHLAIELWSRDIAYIQDLASTNGTYLNGVKISKTRLKDGDIIELGDTRIRFTVEPLHQI